MLKVKGFTSEVKQGENFEISAKITNTGEETGEQEISFEFDNELISTEVVSLDSGQEATVTFSYQIPEDYPAGSASVRIYSENDEDILNVNIQEVMEPAFFDVKIIDNDSVSIDVNFSVKHNFPASKVQSNSKPAVASVDNKDNEGSQLIVRYEAGKRDNVMKSLLDKFEIIDEMKELKAFLIKAEAVELSHEIIEIEGVVSVEENKPMSIYDFILPNDEYYYKQWAPAVIRLPQTWRDYTGGSRVAVVDTGIDYNHLDLENRVDLDSAINFSTDDETDYMDRQSHGTHVAGIIGAEANNEKGLVGVMWGGELIPVKVLGDDGSGDEWNVAKGMMYAANLLEGYNIVPADVINMSLGMTSDTVPDTLQDAVQKVDTESDTIMVAAAGNTGDENVGYPAKFPEVIAVSSLTYQEGSVPTLSGFSSYGAEVDIAAPGDDIWSTTPGDMINTKSGTSMACPQVAGLAGLLISAGVEPTNVLQVMQETAIDLGDELKFGAGMVNTYWACNQVENVKIKVKDENGNLIEEKSIALDRSGVTFKLPKGNYEIIGQIDARGSETLENGDYFDTTSIITIEEDAIVKLQLEEFYQ